MSGKREVLRVGVPVRAVTLVELLGAIDSQISPEATVRHHNGSLIVEDPNPTFANLDGDDAGGS